VRKGETLCKFTKYLAEKGLISGSEGNLSVRERYGFWITPSGRLKEFVTEKDLGFVTWDGAIIGNKPSSEWGMHLEIYKISPEAEAVVHTHPKFVLLMAEKGFDFKKFRLAEAELILRNVEVIEFFPPGSKELWIEAGKAAKHSKVIVLKGHGLVTWGASLEEAVNLTLVLEKLCEIEWNLDLDINSHRT